MLGQVLLLLGDLTSAERAFLSALEVDQNYSLARVHLGLVYILQGNAQGARQEWQSVLSGAPDSAAAEQAQRLMHNYFP
jgi:Flp pilus assembly protein TadD